MLAKEGGIPPQGNIGPRAPEQGGAAEQRDRWEDEPYRLSEPCVVGIAEWVLSPYASCEELQRGAQVEETTAYDPGQCAEQGKKTQGSKARPEGTGEQG